MKGYVRKAQAAFAGRAWGDVYDLLTAADSLEADDLERLAVAAHLVGRDEESTRAWERAHLERERLGEADRAALCAAWLAIDLMLRGHSAQASGWFARAARTIDGAGHDCAASGYLEIPVFLEKLGTGEAAAALDIAEDIVGIGRRHADRDLLALGVLACGQATLALGESARGMNLLDEVMVAVASGEVSPIPAGIVYCAVIEACMDMMDLRRAAEWTEALDNWCNAQSGLVAYRGQCLVHRSQVLQAHGEWAEAAAEVERARQRLSDPAHPALGLALYQQGELHRLRGDRPDAEVAYRGANRHGRHPSPGVALLRLDEGRIEAAVAAVHRMVEETRGQLAHPLMLAAAVEILLAAGDVDAARTAAEELATIAATRDVPLLHATAAHATGAVRLAQGDVVPALAAVRAACTGWMALDMPYEAARARIQIGLACRALGDHDAAGFELDAACATFEALGARPDVARVQRLLAPDGRQRASALTDRECEVIRLVATGRTNREIAAALVISEHTVGRHLQNIFLKLGLSSRAAATAYAYDHELV